MKKALCKIPHSEFNDLANNLKTSKPFHWKVDFGAVFENKGFDVVVGNPPYIEDGNYNEQELKVIECKSHKQDGNGNTERTSPVPFE